MNDALTLARRFTKPPEAKITQVSNPVTMILELMRQRHVLALEVVRLHDAALAADQVRAVAKED